MGLITVQYLLSPKYSHSQMSIFLTKDKSLKLNTNSCINVKGSRKNKKVNCYVYRKCIDTAEKGITTAVILIVVTGRSGGPSQYGDSLCLLHILLVLPFLIPSGVT